MKFVRVLKASEDWKVERRHHDTENGKDYYYIWGPDGEYCDADGEPYHFDTREDALEEVEYLKAEHKFDKKADYSAYTEEDKAVYNETMELLKECRDILNWHYEQGKDMNFDDYQLDETQRLYRKADLEALKQIKVKIDTLFEN